MEGYVYILVLWSTCIISLFLSVCRPLAPAPISQLKRKLQAAVLKHSTRPCGLSTAFTGSIFSASLGYAWCRGLPTACPLSTSACDVWEQDKRFDRKVRKCLLCLRLLCHCLSWLVKQLGRHTDTCRANLFTHYSSRIFVTQHLH